MASEILKASTKVTMRFHLKHLRKAHMNTAKVQRFTRVNVSVNREVRTEKPGPWRITDEMVRQHNSYGNQGGNYAIS